MRRVPSIGPKHAKIALIGEFPGESEESQGRPFVGATGQILDSILSEVGINRHECFITNVVKYRPTDNNFDLFYNDGPRRREPSPILVSAIEELQTELDALSLNVVVLLGNEALRAVTGKGGIFNWRGSILPTRWGKAIPSFNPAYVLRQYPSRALVVADLRRALRESATRELDLPKHNFLLSPSFDQVMEWLSKPGERMAFDIETTEGGTIRCLGLSWDHREAICIPFMKSVPDFDLFNGVLVESQTKLNSYWTTDQEWEILRRLNEIFLDRSIRKVAHNYPFDAPLLEREFGIHCRGFFMDTLGVQHTCFAELPKDLGTCCSLYTKVPCYWDISHSIDEQLWLYNCYDAAVTLEISYVLEKQLERLGLREVYFKRLNNALINTTRMMKRGLFTDEEFKIKNRDENLIEMNQAETIAKELTGDPNFNARSSPQVQKLLYQQLGLAVQFNRETKKPTADKDAISRLLRIYPEHSSLLEPLGKFRSLASLHDRFLGVPSPPDNCFRTHLNIFGTVNGRAASSDPLFEMGTNLQNIKRGPFRRMFRARDRYLMIKADLSQAELRFVVWRARIISLIERYEKNKWFDTYTFIASLVYNRAEEFITKEERYLTKQGVLASLYGTQPPTLAATIKIDLKTARFVLTRIHSLFPEIGQWWETIRQKLQTSRCITNPFGRKRFFLDRMGDSLYRDGYNAEPQSFVADLIWTALNAIEERWYDCEEEARILLQIHDELLAEALKEQAKQRALELREAMEIPVQIWPDLPLLIIPVEVGIGPNWYDVEILHD